MLSLEFILEVNTEEGKCVSIYHYHNAGHGCYYYYYYYYGKTNFNFLTKNPSSIWPRFDSWHECGVFVVESGIGTGVTPSRSIFPLSQLFHHCSILIHHQHSFSWQFTVSLNNTHKKSISGRYK